MVEEDRSRLGAVDKSDLTVVLSPSQGVQTRMWHPLDILCRTVGAGLRGAGSSPKPEQHEPVSSLVRCVGQEVALGYHFPVEGYTRQGSLASKRRSLVQPFDHQVEANQMGSDSSAEIDVPAHRPELENWAMKRRSSSTVEHRTRRPSRSSAIAACRSRACSSSVSFSTAARSAIALPYGRPTGHWSDSGVGHHDRCEATHD